MKTARELWPSIACRKRNSIMLRYFFWPTSEGWPSLLDSNDPRCFLWNRLFFIDLSSLPKEATACLFSQFIFVVFYHRPSSVHGESWMTRNFDPARGLSDVTFCNWNLFMSTSDLGLAVVEFFRSPRIYSCGKRGSKVIMKTNIMESCGEMVHMHIHGDIEKHVNVFVRKMDLSKKASAAVDSIGSDGVFFLGGEVLFHGRQSRVRRQRRLCLLHCRRQLSPEGWDCFRHVCLIEMQRTPHLFYFGWCLLYEIRYIA